MPSKAPSDSPEPSRRSRIVLTLAVLAITLALDLWTKAWAWEHLRRGKPVMVIDPLLELAFSFNLGAAFGFLNDASWSRFFFIGVTVLALAYMTWLALTLPTRRAYGFVAVGLIAAGAAGNLHDRLVRANEGGHYGVVDFIKVNYPWGGSWPTFNVADALLLIGVATLLVYLRREADDLDPSAKKVDPGPPGPDAARKDLARPAAEDDPIRPATQPLPTDGVPADPSLDAAAD
jgi:signal peptidase II